MEISTKPDNVLHYLLKLKRFVQFVGRRFIQDNCLQVAASLAYTSLLSLVPLMAVMISMLAAFPGFQTMGQDIQDFIFSNFVPTSSDVLQTHLQSFAAKATRLTMVGIAVLLLTALMMMSTIDKSLNQIWASRSRRRGASRFLVYWAVLSLGPVLVGLGMVATSYVASLPLLTDSMQSAGMRTIWLRSLPLITTALAFTLMYIVIPVRSVPFRAALVGGLVAGILFESAKRGFAWYVVHFPTYEAIYGALASIPIFLIWIYLSWLIILLGAVVAHAYIVFRDDETELPHTHKRFLLGTRIVAHLWQAQRQGETLGSKELTRLEDDINEDDLADILSDLQTSGIVQQTDRSRWVLMRDPSDLTLLQLYRSVPGPLYSSVRLQTGDQGWEQSVEQVIANAGKSVESALDISLRDVLMRAEHPAVQLEQQPVQTLDAEFSSAEEKEGIPTR